MAARRSSSATCTRSQVSSSWAVRNRWPGRAFLGGVRVDFLRGGSLRGIAGRPSGLLMERCSPQMGVAPPSVGLLLGVRSGSPSVLNGRPEGVGWFPHDRFGEEHIRWNAAVPGIRHDRVKRLDDAWVGRPETHVVSEVQVLVIGIPMTDENLTAVDHEDGSPSVPRFRVADIDLPTDDLRRGLILRRDPRRGTDGDSGLRAVPVRIDEEPAASDDAHLRRTHDHFLLSALDHLPELADDRLPLSEQEEIACWTRRGSRRDVGHEPRRTPLQVVFRRAQLLSAPLDEGLQGDRSVAKGLGRYDGNEAFRMEGFEDFVDPTSRYTGDARDLGRLRFPAFEQEQIDPRFVRTQPERDRQLESIGLAPRTLRERLAHLNLPYGPSNIKLTPPRSSVRESLPEPFFFFQAEDGIRDLTVTGVQTCALPISRRGTPARTGCRTPGRRARPPSEAAAAPAAAADRAGESCDIRGSAACG